MRCGEGAGGRLRPPLRHPRGDGRLAGGRWAARHRCDRHRHALAHALGTGDRRARGGQARPLREARRLRLPRHAQSGGDGEGEGAEDETRLHLPLQPRRALREGVDRSGLHRHAVHLQWLRAELAVARSAVAPPASAAGYGSIGHPGLVARGIWRAGHRPQPLVGRRGLRAGRRHDAQLRPGADGARDGPR